MASHSLHLPIREDWLALTVEETLDPALPIVDAHHHLWDLAEDRYLLDEMGADLGCGHNVRATIYIQCGAAYRADGPEAMRPVGETEFANGVAAMSASGHYGKARVAAGIVGHANLAIGSPVREVLQAHIAAGNGRFRGVRHISTWHDHPDLVNVRHPAPRGLLSDRLFRDGFAQLAPLGLSFDAWLYQTQIEELAGLARAFPGTAIIVDHLGGPLRSGPYRGHEDMAFSQWKSAMMGLADCPNVNVKLGGMGMKRIGFDLFEKPKPLSSIELADLWRPYIETCIEAFGVERCMFESNFPVDKVSCGYNILWNAFKRVARGASEREKSFLFADTASNVYRLNLTQDGND